MRELRLRDAVRAIVVDPSCSVLLVRFEFEHWIGWATPGGGVDSGETDEEAIRRELAEEVGLEGFELGPLVWTRTHLLELADWAGQVEPYYFVRRSPWLTALSRRRRMCSMACAAVFNRQKQKVCTLVINGT